MTTRGDSETTTDNAADLDDRWQALGVKLAKRSPRGYVELISALETILADLETTPGSYQET